MIPLQKFSKLPRSLRLRKAASIFGGAEHRFIIFGKLSCPEMKYLENLLKLLSQEEDFPTAALEAFKIAETVFRESQFGLIRRSLNNVYHILLTETGRNSADWDFYESPGVLDGSKRQPFPGMQIYLEDIRSPYNVGSMFRAAESFGAEKVWLSPLCADPRHKRAERTAMGCVEILPWERFSFEQLTGPFFALETGGTRLPDFSFPSQGILIAGSEELGVSPQALAAADASLGRVTIPSYGAKGSLNVSVAFGIVMQAWAEKLSKL